ncbi:hypothetical protein GOP47_0028626 [Adiantum capillus-veneris]|nr:hypothetical protein GOP47_0028626 [Adiantum capillus-veneris]
MMCPSKEAEDNTTLVESFCLWTKSLQAWSTTKLWTLRKSHHICYWRSSKFVHNGKHVMTRWELQIKCKRLEGSRVRIASEIYAHWDPLGVEYAGKLLCTFGHKVDEDPHTRGPHNNMSDPTQFGSNSRQDFL